MQILDIKILNGPNIWSITTPKLIVLKLIAQKKESSIALKAHYFFEALNALIISSDLTPTQDLSSLKQQFGENKGISISLQEMIAYVAIELQRIAGFSCQFCIGGHSVKEDIYYAIFEYELEEAGNFAAQAASNIVRSIMSAKLYFSLKEDIDKLAEIQTKFGLGPSTKSIVLEAQKRNIPYVRLNKQSLVMFGYGRKQKLINGTAFSTTSIIGDDLVRDKDFTKKILADAYIPVPSGIVIKNLKQLKQSLKTIDAPFVIKPLDANHGRGVTTNIVSQEKAYIAYKLARKFSTDVIVEHFIDGFDYRFLVINYKLAAVAKRTPAFIRGDGVSTIQQLIQSMNEDPRRGDNHENFLTKIKIDETTLEILKSHALSLESILPLGQELFLKYSANISTGGTAIDVTDQVHADNFQLAERTARLLNLNICGIDVVCKNIGLPLTKENGAIIEVNASPGLRMHLQPYEGKHRNIAEPIIDMLFPSENEARIPIVAVTGTNGKTTTVRLIANFASNAGHTVGFTTTDGIYIKNKLIYKGDCSGPLSAQMVLREPIVDFAVFECARGGILSRGLGFDQCDVSIVTNITADHLGLGDIETLEDLAKVKSVVPKSTSKDGYAILNADDDLVYAMKEELNCNIGLFSMQENNPRIQQHCSNGGIAAYLKNDNILVSQGDIRKIFANINEIPLTHFGSSTAMTQDILAAVLAGVVSKFSFSQMSKQMKNFSPSPENIPGRMNLFEFDHFKVLVDYGHNVGAFIELKKYVENIKCNQKIGIIGAPGDRRNEDIINIGYYSSQIFDDIIIKHDMYGRGRSNQEITSLLKKGIAKDNDMSKGNEMNHVTVISDEQKALEFAISKAKKGAFIAYFPEDISRAVEYLRKISKSDLKSSRLR